jgi:hypothetical protein
LDQTLQFGNDEWNREEALIRRSISDFHEATQLVIDIMPEGKAGRKYLRGKWESRFNRVLLEVQAYYLLEVGRPQLEARKDEFVLAFQGFLDGNGAFLESIESTTKTIERYYTRFSEFQKFVNAFFGLKLNCVPTPTPVVRDV